MHQNIPNPKRLAKPPTDNLKAEEIAPEFNVCKKTFLNWFSAGIVPASIAVGRVLRFNLADCREALKRHSDRDA